MDIKKILASCDHTLLAQNATAEEIFAICDDGIKYGTASVCIPPSRVKQAKEYVGDRLKICTVIGFPLGYSDTRVKVLEAELAILDGADEIDTVINIGHLKDGRFDLIADELRKIRKATEGKILKVIIETCLLTREEKAKMCRIVSEAKADYIKTSTGFSTAGATDEDIIVFNENLTGDVKIKAAGGIKTLEDAERFLNLGATRLGTSRVVKIVKSEENISDY